MAFKSLATSGIINFAKYQNALVGNAAYIPDPTSDFLITETVLSSQSSSISFDISSLSSTYKHLQIRVVARSDRAIASDYVRVRFNGDTGANYSWHNLYTDGTNSYSEYSAPETGMHVERIAAANSATNVFGVAIIDLLDVFSNNKYKTIKSIGGVYGAEDSTGRRVQLHSGNWRSLAVPTSVSVTVGGGSVFVTGSRFSLYGIKA